MMENIFKEESRKKASSPKIHKGPLMQNRRENRNTRKAKMFRFTQRLFQQNRRVTINKILDGTLSLKKEDDIYPDIKEVEEVYLERLEKVKVKDTSNQPDVQSKHNDCNGRITNDEIKEALKGIKRDTTSGADKCRLCDIRNLTIEEISAIFSKWWSLGIPDEVVKCKTTLLPKSVKESEKVGNWRPIIIGNLLMRLYGKMWENTSH